MSYIHTEQFSIRTSEINHNKSLHASALIQLMQEASMQHTIGMKVSVWDMEAIQGGWVLLKMEVQFYHYPVLGQKVTVKTYPSGLDGYFTYRDYFMYDDNDTLCATATTMWTMMNTESRKMVKIPFSFQSLVYTSDTPLNRPTKKLYPATTEVLSNHVKVNYFHLDWNGHVNNVQLIRFIMESLDNSMHYEKTLDSFAIQFKNEAVLDQELFIYNEDISDHHYRHLITDKTTGKDILTAESVWK